MLGLDQGLIKGDHGSSGPVLVAAANATVSLASNAYTKLLYPTVVTQSGGNYSSSTYTPGQTGIYFVTAVCSIGDGNRLLEVVIRKNGSNYAFGNSCTASSSSSVLASTLVVVDSATDYIEAFAFSGVGASTASASATNKFSICFLRSL